MMQTGEQVEENLAEELVPLSRNLASLLRHRAVDLGLHIRSDGFVNLQEILSRGILNKCLQALVETGKDVDESEKVVNAIRQVVSKSTSNGGARFELWEGQDADVWIRATHKHSIAHLASRADDLDSDRGNGQSLAESAQESAAANGWDNLHAGHEAGLWVGRLPLDFGEVGLRQLFESHGQIKSIKVFAEKRYGFVNFATQSEAASAVQTLNGANVQGSQIIVRFAERKLAGDRHHGCVATPAAGWQRGGQRDSGGETLFVKGLPSNLVEDDILKIFGPYGALEVTKLPSRPSNGEGHQGTAVALLRMATLEDAAWLVENVNGNIPVGLSDPVGLRYAKSSAGGPTLPRQRITTEVILGEAVAWMGTYGWIVPRDPLDHPASTKHGGKIYAHQKDLLQATEITAGCCVRCHVYVDTSGLGAEEVQVVADPAETSNTVTQGTAASSSAVADSSAGRTMDWQELLGDDRSRKHAPSAARPQVWQAAQVAGEREQPCMSPLFVSSHVASAPVEQTGDPYSRRDAQLGVPAPSASAGPATLPRVLKAGCQGRIKTYDPSTGYGFVVSEAFEKDIFLQRNNIIGEPPGKVTSLGPAVEFDLEVRGGRPRAVNARVEQLATGVDAVDALHDEGSPQPAQSTLGRWESSTSTSAELAGLIKVLPHDAPPEVMAYLTSLVQHPGRMSL